MERSRKTAIWLVLTAMLLEAVQGGEDSIHYVGGGKYNWRPNVNFTEWSNQERFYVGDWLYFGFDKYMYNVLEVNKTSYEKCIETDFVTNVTKGGRDVFELKEARQYFFISGRGFCFGGLKVEINVTNAPTLLPPVPSPPKNNASSPSNSRRGILLLLAFFWIFFL